MESRWKIWNRDGANGPETRHRTDQHEWRAGVSNLHKNVIFYFVAQFKWYFAKPYRSCQRPDALTYLNPRPSLTFWLTFSFVSSLNRCSGAPIERPIGLLSGFSFYRDWQPYPVPNRPRGDLPNLLALMHTTRSKQCLPLPSHGKAL